jgi:hypothetical protein
MANTYLQKTFATTGDRQKFTLSMWFKRGIVPVGNQAGTEGMLFQAYQDSSSQDQVWLQSNGTINYVRNNANAVTPSPMFRDPSAWYHVVFAGDTTQGSNADRLKVYINGTQAPIGQQDTITQHSNFGAINNAQLYTFGKRNSDDWYFDGSMSHIHLIDGTAYDASAFGETDATTGEWKIKASPSVTYGTNGFFILKDDNVITDQSVNSNDFSLGAGTLTKTEDNPSNNFCTLNPLIPSQTNYVYQNGNNSINQTSGAWVKSMGTIGITSGKYYWEYKPVDVDNAVSGKYMVAGIGNQNYDSVAASGLSTGGIHYKSEGTIWVNSAAVGTLSTYVAGNVIGCYVDMDNGFVYFAKDGVLLNGGVPTSGGTGTGGFAIPTPTVVFPSLSAYGTGSLVHTNFGNGSFGSTAIASAGINASLNGLFEYDVPAGYTALSTKGLNI